MKEQAPAAPRRRASSAIEIVGASANNLKDVDVRLPLGAATLVVGVSGSGKSSLLADTLAREANARMKRFLGVSQDHLTEEDVAAFLGPVPPSIHFTQGAFRASRRTTVATCSGLLATLRQLFRRHGTAWSEVAGEAVPEPSPESFGAWLKRYYRGRLRLWAVPMRFVAGDGVGPAAALEALGLKQAVVRSETDSPRRFEEGRTVALSSFRPLAAQVRHIMEAEVANLSLPAKNPREWIRALERTFDAGGGTVVLELLDAGPELEALRGPHGVCLDSDRHHLHPADPRPYAPPSAALLSFNMPSNERSGACLQCEGVGESLGVPEELLVTAPQRSLHDGALALWTQKNYKYVNVQHETIEGLAGLCGFDPHLPWSKLPPQARNLVLYGSGDVGVTDRDPKSGRKLGAPRPFEGFVPAILRRYRRGSRTAERLRAFVRQGPCPSCHGSRWSYQARALRVGGQDIAGLLALPFLGLVERTRPSSDFARHAPAGARSLIGLLHHHANSFVGVGLGHLSGDRGMLTLSEGESRRVRLAGLLNARGRGLALLLDEPARGLHEADIGALLTSLRQLKRSHTVVLNDHRLSLAGAVDHVIELGPGAGQDGGQVVRYGSPQEVLGQVPPGKKPGIAAVCSRRRLPVSKRHPSLRVHGGNLYTLRDIACRIPLGRLVSITGVSGSGKSNFVRGILLPALVAELGDEVDLEGFATRPGHWKRFDGASNVKEVMALEQRSPTTNRRSLIATFLGIADLLRRAFATVAEARRLKLSAADFGLNSGQGRCPECLGLGQREDSTGWTTCPGCGGRRFGEAVLAVRLEGLHMVELLEWPLSELATRELPFLTDLAPLFSLLVDLDLGYLHLGRRMDQLSGGEVQRLRIAKRLWRGGARDWLLVLDEPSAGLHPEDTARLFRVLDRIVGDGENTVVLIEHNLDLIRASDWIIDFGPGGGPHGGKVLAQGPPQEIRSLATPTAVALRHRPTSGRRWSPAHKAQPAGSTPSRPTVEGAREARTWLKVLLGQEVVLPSATDSPNPSPAARPNLADDEDRQDIEDLAVEVDAAGLAQCRPYEIGGLDRELARLILAVHRPLAERLAVLEEVWARRPEARLWIHPLLYPLQVWGPQIPASDLKAGLARLPALGLEESLGALPHSTAEAVLELRAGGRRFHPTSQSQKERHSLLVDALTIGGGYVELRDTANEVLVTAGTRYLDLAAGIVAPATVTAESLCRSHALGRCPACLGKGSVPQFDPKLLVRDHRKPPAAEEFLRREALALLKGVRRLVLVPFLRKLAEEGFWDLGRSFARLSERERDLVFFGYWHRPGHGSFLKHGRSDPGEVGSWLRWDGLYRVLLEQIERSSDGGWRDRVKGSLSQRPCLLCEGSGLTRTSRVVRFGELTLCEWAVSANLGQLCRTLKDLKTHSAMERQLRDRLLYCLRPAASKRPDAPLCLPLDPEDARRVYERAVAAFTGLEVVG